MAAARNSRRIGILFSYTITRAPRVGELPRIYMLLGNTQLNIIKNILEAENMEQRLKKCV